MTDTGRIRGTLAAAAREIVFERRTPTDDDRRVAELRAISTVDMAHVVMLAERGVVGGERAGKLLTAVGELRATRFAPLRPVQAPRGLYLAYESLLIETLGEDVGGVLHSGRSRNDLNATVLLLRLRDPYLRLVRAVLRLGAVLLRRARQNVDVVMPLYTHYQPALPITYGHYLLGIASALGRELRAIEDAARDLDESPLGAGAGAGTSIPIDPARTAALLGFARPMANSLEAVASRAHVLRLLAAATSLGVLLGRLAQDLLLWTTQEVAMLALPDELVGSSSMMPQKRNPFLLEHVQGKAAAPLGALVAAATAMHGTPFTNVVATGTEAVSPAVPALEAVTDAATLVRLVVAGAVPDRRAMHGRAVHGLTSATVLAERLTLAGMPFRSAHRTVGAAIRETLESGTGDLVAAADHLGLPTAGLDPESARDALQYGGGPGGSSLAPVRRDVRLAWRATTELAARRARRWQDGADALEQAARGIRARHGPPGTS